MRLITLTREAQSFRCDPSAGVSAVKTRFVARGRIQRIRYTWFRKAGLIPSAAAIAGVASLCYRPAGARSTELLSRSGITAWSLRFFASVPRVASVDP